MFSSVHNPDAPATHTHRWCEGLGVAHPVSRLCVHAHTLQINPGSYRASNQAKKPDLSNRSQTKYSFQITQINVLQCYSAFSPHNHWTQYNTYTYYTYISITFTAIINSKYQLCLWRSIPPTAIMAMFLPLALQKTR